MMEAAEADEEAEAAAEAAAAAAPGKEAILAGKR
jgi:hypothetical protein